jgi:hypothetical protein
MVAQQNVPPIQSILINPPYVTCGRPKRVPPCTLYQVAMLGAP